MDMTFHKLNNIINIKRKMIMIYTTYSKIKYLIDNI